MKYELVIFDFDGTLADSFPWFISVFNEVAGKFAFRRIRDEEIDSLRELSGREMMAELGVPTWKLPLIATHMRKLKSRDIDSIKLFPGVPAMLRRLHDAGVGIGIVSSNARENVTRVLGPENAALVSFLECGGSVFGKASMLTKVVLTSGVRPERTLCIGDELRDLEAARKAKLPFGAVSWGYTTPASLAAQQPAELFATMDDIISGVLAA